jgi:hypothetical protein
VTPGASKRGSGASRDRNWTRLASNGQASRPLPLSRLATLGVRQREELGELEILFVEVEVEVVLADTRTRRVRVRSGHARLVIVLTNRLSLMTKL